MPEDRDQLFEKALARQLRAAADGPAASLCLDPETLAAYHQRGLSAEELISAKSHIASCSRCQEILAQLEKTEEVNELQGAAEADPAMDLVTVASASSQVLRKTTAGPAELARAAVSSEKVVAIPRSKYSSLRWAAPAGAIAAALLIWIGVRDARMKMTAPASTVQVAENRQQAPSSPREESKEVVTPQELEKQKAAGSADRMDEAMHSPRDAAASESSVLRDKKDSAVAGKLENKEPPAGSGYSARTRASMGGARGPSAAAAQAQANNALQRGDQAAVGGAPQIVEAVPAPTDLDKAEPQRNQPALAAKSAVAGGFAKAAPAAPPPPAPKPEPGRLSGTVTDPSGAAIAGASVELKSASGAPVASTSTDTGGAYSFAGVAAGNYELQLQSPGFKTDTLTGLNIAPGDNVMNAKLEIGASTETVEVTAQPVVVNSQAAEITTARESKTRNMQALLLASSGLQTVASPDGEAIWKFGEMGQILHSKNAGKEWASEASGVTVKLLAASAPSARVCWIAGVAGTLLRTIDGGKRWRRITVPISGDLGGVHAWDALHASIWDAPNRARYETTDGGTTWKRTAE